MCKEILAVVQKMWNLGYHWKYMFWDPLGSKKAFPEIVLVWWWSLKSVFNTGGAGKMEK